MMVLTPNNRTSPSFTLHHSLQCCCPHAACHSHPCPAPLPHLLPSPCLPPCPCLGRQREPSCWAGSRASTLAPGELHVVVLLSHSPVPGQGSPPGWVAAGLAHPECLSCVPAALPTCRQGRPEHSQHRPLLPASACSPRAPAARRATGQGAGIGDGQEQPPSPHCMLVLTLLWLCPCLQRPASTPQVARGLHWPPCEGS